nr:low-specificity L-threonine aldolase [Rhodoferax sp.]
PLALADIDAAIKPDDPHFARTRLLSIENTLGGKLLPLEYLQQATDLAKQRGLARHLDGARLFNAAVAQAAQTGTDAATEARRIAQCFDSVSVCLSKGLGAPVGSVLCGSRELMARALRVRKMAGGGMRQSGLLAAAGSYALAHHVNRLADDHALAKRLAEGLQDLPGVVVDAPHTNIVFVNLVGEARAQSHALVAFLAEHGVLATGLYQLRFVTHLNVDEAGVEHAIRVMRQFFKA